MADQPKKRFKAGPLDVFIILFLGETERFHPCLACYSPLPGQRDTPLEQLLMIRYRSKQHHTKGFATIEEARAEIVELRKTWIDIADGNVFTDTAVCAQRPVFTITVINWTKSAQDHPLGDLGPLITRADKVVVARVG